MVYILQKLIWLPFVLMVKFFLKFNVKGQKNFKKLKTNKYIIVANHLGFLDAYLVSASIPFSHFLKTSFRYMMKPKWFIIYPFVRWFGAYPVYRKQGSLEKTLESTEEYIKSGKNILIFPEGTFPRGGKRPKPKQGVVYLSKKYNLPILPVALKGGDGVNGDGKLDFKKVFSRKYRVNIEVGEPFYYKDVASDNMDSQKAAEKIMKRVNVML